MRKRQRRALIDHTRLIYFSKPLSNHVGPFVTLSIMNLLKVNRQEVTTLVLIKTDMMNYLFISPSLVGGVLARSFVTRLFVLWLFGCCQIHVMNLMSLRFLMKNGHLALEVLFRLALVIYCSCK